MLRGWLIYREQDAIENKTYIDWFITEAKKQAIHLTLMLRETLTIGIKNGRQICLHDSNEADLPHFIVMRTIEPLLQTFFETKGIRTFNTSVTAQLSNNKNFTHLALYELGIPMVETYFYSKLSLPNILPLQFPFIMKDAHGRSGQQVFLIKNENEWQHKLTLLETNDFLIQTLNEPVGRDLRVFIIGKEIIAAVLRENKHDFRANFKLGGSAIKYDLSESDEAMIQQIINHFDFDLVGIDFLINEDGDLLFNEIEDVVGSRILSKATNINLLEKYITYIKQSMPFPK